jgi:hypothetical protein
MRTGQLKPKTRWACYLNGAIVFTAESYRDKRGASMEFKRLFGLPRMPHNTRYWRIK